MTAIDLSKRKACRNRICQLMLIIFYLGFHIFLLQHHEAWRDESQAWILARNSSFSDLFGLCASEGHPVLWFLILKLCIALGMPFLHFGLISICFMGIAAKLMVQHAPFSLITKLSILLSPAFFYYNPIICRIYSVVVFLVCIICTLWPVREEKPVLYGIAITLLFQSHILMAGLAIGCLLEQCFSFGRTFSWRKFVGIILPTLSLIGLFFQLRQTPETETFLKITPDSLFSRFSGVSFKNAIHSVLEKFQYSGFPAGKLALGLMLSLLLVLFFEWRKSAFLRRANLRATFVCFCGLGGYWAIILFIRSAEHIQIAIVSLLFPFFLIWLVMQNQMNSVSGKERINSGSGGITISKKILEAILCACCMVLLPKSAVLDPLADLTGSYSGSLEMAEKIETLAEEHAVIVLPNNSLATSIAAYLYDSPKNYIIWDIDNGEEFGIHKWGRENVRKFNSAAIEDFILKDLKEGGSVYYVQTGSSPDLKDLSTDRMKLLAKNVEDNTWNEYYQLYRIGDNEE